MGIKKCGIKFDTWGNGYQKGQSFTVPRFCLVFEIKNLVILGMDVLFNSKSFIASKSTVNLY